MNMRKIMEMVDGGTNTVEHWCAKHLYDPSNLLPIQLLKTAKYFVINDSERGVVLKFNFMAAIEVADRYIEIYAGDGSKIGEIAKCSHVNYVDAPKNCTWTTEY